MTSRRPHTVAQMVCSMKLKYASERIANVRAVQLTESRGVQLYAYKCKACGSWHHTKRKPFARPARKVQR